MTWIQCLCPTVMSHLEQAACLCFVNRGLHDMTFTVGLVDLCTKQRPFQQSMRQRCLTNQKPLWDATDYSKASFTNKRCAKNSILVECLNNIQMSKKVNLNYFIHVFDLSGSIFTIKKVIVSCTELKTRVLQFFLFCRYIMKNLTRRISFEFMCRKSSTFRPLRDTLYSLMVKKHKATPPLV